MGFTMKDIEERLKAGTILGYVDKSRDKEKGASKCADNTPGEKKMTKRKADKIKGWILLHLGHWCEANRLELWHADNEKGEFMFDPERLWRFDWAIPKKKLAFEYEGINSKKSRHTTKMGYTGDADKYNEAAAQGWRVIRYTAQNYKQLLTDLNRLI
jgi:hypothetical protein